MVMKLKTAITAIEPPARAAPTRHVRTARVYDVCRSRARGRGAAAGLFFSFIERYIEDRRGGSADGESR